MDDKNQTQVQKTQNTQIVQTDQVNQSGQNVQTAQPIPSVSIHKEQAPVAVSPEQIMQPTEKAPELYPEVAEVGVEHVVQMPALTPSQQQAGVAFAKESIPHPTSPSGMVQLPMTTEQAQQVVKTHKTVTDSIYWLATLVLMQVKRMHEKVIST